MSEIQKYDPKTQIATVLQTFPPEAQQSAAIVAEVCRILAESPTPQPELAALKKRCWDAAIAVDTMHVHQPTVNITNNITIRNSFNRTSTRTSSTSNTQGFELPTFPVLAALSALIVLSLLSIGRWSNAYYYYERGYTEGAQQGQ